MKNEKLIIQRFAELEQRAADIWENKKVNYTDKGVDHYKVDAPDVKGWGINVLNLLGRVFNRDSEHYRFFYAYITNFTEYDFQFKKCLAIFKAAKEDYEGGYLFNLRGLIQAEVFDDVLEQSTYLLKAGYKDAACVVAGVALETTLKELCSRNNISHSKLDKMNADLCKAGIYNMGMQKQITAWAERRNKAAHGDWSAYNETDVEDLIRGVTRLIADYL